MSETVFSRIRHYEVLDEIGGGGMAQVFLARDTRSNQRVALRRVTSRAADVLDAEQEGAELQKRFWPHCKLVPEVFETFMSDGAFVVAMEYIPGEDLSVLIRKGPVQPARACAIAVALCQFLEAAKEFRASVNGRQLQHLLHGDLTPGNVRLIDDGLRVLDFGISKALSASRKVTQSDFGNIAYLSPERLENGAMDATDGFWSVGVILYEMVKGQKPFYAEDTRRLEHRITSRRPPESLNGVCPDGLCAIVAKLLAPSASSRYDDARLIREDLERCIAGESTVAQQEGWPDAADASPSTRRTRPASALLDEATRRTPRPGAAPSPAQGGTLPPTARLAGRMAAVFRRFPWLSGMLVATVLIAGVVLGVNQLRVYGEAASLSGVVHTSDGFADLMKVWGRYDELSDRSYLRLGVRPLERALVDRTQVMADRVIRNYSTGVSGIREAQWKETRAPLLLAVAVAPDDQQLRASLRFIDGHLHRIDGNANWERQQVQAARKEFAESLTAFREAAELRATVARPVPRPGAHVHLQPRRPRERGRRDCAGAAAGLSIDRAGDPAAGGGLPEAWRHPHRQRVQARGHAAGRGLVDARARGLRALARALREPAERRPPGRRVERAAQPQSGRTAARSVDRRGGPRRLERSRR